MISAFGIEHTVSKGIHAIQRDAQIMKPGINSVKAAMMYVGKNPNAKKRVGQLRPGDPRFDTPNSIRAFKHSKEKKTRSALVPVHPKEIQKSYVPGVGFGAASELSRKGREAVKAGVATSRASRKTMGTTEQFARKNTPKKRKIYPGDKTPLQSLVVKPSARLDRRAKEDGGLAGYSRPNGRGGGYVKVYHDVPDKELTLRHEMAHITPRRNPHTLQQRAQDPKRLGREEGRADYIAHGKKTPAHYPDRTGEARKFQGGYNEVQRKMAAAQRRKK